MINIETTQAVELNLNDSFQVVDAQSEDMTLPAVLCDDKLLEEINNIPQKMAFKIGDVADMLGIKQYVLRYWETEFEVLKPKKAANNQRMYSRKDVENAFIIRKLLHRDRFSIEGARNALKELKNYVKKERESSLNFHKYEYVNEKLHEKLHERVENILSDLRRLRSLFQ